MEKDLDKFIRAAKGGAYQFDYKCGGEGLKLIKAYFRMIEAEYKQDNYAVARACYKNLMFLLLQSDYNYFNYEDIVGKLNFEKFIGNYFTCLIHTCDADELFKEYVEYLKVKVDYGFDSAHVTIINSLPEPSLSRFMELVTKEAENVTEEDYAMHDMIDLLLDMAKSRSNKEEFDRLSKKYEHILGDDMDGELA
ncbi:MAG: hypothetical protein AABY09_05440 [Nanoarchaeota archaeon]